MAFRVFVNQFKSPLIYLLLAAATISLLLGRFTDSAFIIAVLVFNASLGAVQEYKANKAAEALNVYLKPKAKVIRDGKEVEIDADQLVTGDKIILESGDRIPADSKLTEAHLLKLDESALTGESLPVEKREKDEVFAGTLVVSGRGFAKVFAAGVDTKIGKLAKFVTEAKEVTSPLKRKIAYLAKQLVVVIIFLSAAIFIFGVVAGFAKETMFLTAIALTVSSIPEGLPVALTVILTIGMHRMAKRNVIIRRLDAVESLGSVTTICIDKTGTLTSGEITAQKIIINDQTINISGAGFQPEGDFFINAGKIDKKNLPVELLKLLRVAALTNDARLRPVDGKQQVIGDPTEGALLVLAKKARFDLVNLANRYPRIAEFPFDPKLKYMATLHRNGGQPFKGKQLAMVKGAPAAVLAICQKSPDDGKLLNEARQMAKSGLRVMAFAVLEIGKEWRGITHESIFGKMSFLGLVGFSDPIRPETAEMVAKVKAAGIRLIIITGDHRLTAQAIAREANIGHLPWQIIDGDELDEMSDQTFSQRIKNTVIFARITPDQKTRIVKALQKAGEIVAMTGDGVNDGPALVTADVGVGMGRIGTDVAKEASDLVITDDNLATIYAAVEEGRVIFANIKKLVLYLLSGSLGGLVLVGGAIILGFGLPLTIGQILWINVVTDSLPDIALAFEPKEKEIMSGPNRLSKENIFGPSGQLLVLTIALTSGMLTILIFAIAQQTTGGVFASTLAFTVFAVNTLLYVFALKSINKPIWQTQILSNNLLNLAVVFGFLLVLTAIYFPPLAQILGNKPLMLNHWLVVVTVSLLVVVVIEVLKRVILRQELREN